MVSNTRGFIIPNMTTITLFLAVAGVWYLHKAYINGDLKSDLKSMVIDGQAIARAANHGEDHSNSNFITKVSELSHSLFRKFPTPNTSSLNTGTSAPASGASHE